jgi:hypothetical protein
MARPWTHLERASAGDRRVVLWLVVFLVIIFLLALTTPYPGGNP